MSSNRPILTDPDIADYLSYLIECAAIQYKNCPAMEDILQETMLAVLLELRKMGSIAYPMAFLSILLMHKYNDWLR
ncbi:MAG: sigma-70 family RNA polymerase sigma factor, partial [Clostridia bacterium]|nr:sigma-70 family RNA polymerase sigma factor [Clostridia bacterium]